VALPCAAQALQPARDAHQLALSIIAELGDGEYCSLHVRRGDKINDPEVWRGPLLCCCLVYPCHASRGHVREAVAASRVWRESTSGNEQWDDGMSAVILTIACVWGASLVVDNNLQQCELFCSKGVQDKQRREWDVRMACCQVVL
jgi:hypothetical protein